MGVAQESQMEYNIFILLELSQNEEAEVKKVFRKELKYRISKIEFSKLNRILEQEMELDDHGQEGGYWIRSLYFDSEYDNDLQDVLGGHLNKAKLRLRIYSLEQKWVKLEYKCKIASDQIKYTLEITRDQAQKMIAGEYGFLMDFSDEVATEIYIRLISNAYRPKVMVEYRRIAYVYEANDTRITFDTDVKATMDVRDLFSEDFASIPLIPSDTGVLEVKYNHFLCSFIQRALSFIDLNQVANSKYAMGRLSL